MKNLLPKLFFLPFFLVFSLSPSASSANILDRVVAVVGQEPILQSEIQSEIALIKASPVYASIVGISAAQVSQQKVLERKIDEKVIETVAKELQISVPDSEVDKQVESIAKQNGLTRKQLESSLKSEGIAFAAYVSNIRAQLQKRNVFDREVRKNTTPPSDAQLREAYSKKAASEYFVVLLKIPAKDTNKVLEQHKAGKLSGQDLIDRYAEQSLDWVSPNNLKKDLGDVLKRSSTNTLSGPVKVGSESLYVYVKQQRVGSEEQFQEMKGQLQAEIQASEFESRFLAWMDRKKKELQIVVNQ